MPESHEGEKGARGDEGQVVLAQVQVYQVQHALEGSERRKPGRILTTPLSFKYIFPPCTGSEIVLQS